MKNKKIFAIVAIALLVVVSGCTSNTQNHPINTTSNKTDEIKTDIEAITIEDDTSETLQDISDSIKGVQDSLVEK